MTKKQFLIPSLVGGAVLALIFKALSGKSTLAKKLRRRTR